MQLYFLFPGEYTQGVLFPTEQKAEPEHDDWTTATFFNH